MLIKIVNTWPRIKLVHFQLDTEQILYRHHKVFFQQIPHVHYFARSKGNGMLEYIMVTSCQMNSQLEDIVYSPKNYCVPQGLS